MAGLHQGRLRGHQARRTDRSAGPSATIFRPSSRATSSSPSSRRPPASRCRASCSICAARNSRIAACAQALTYAFDFESMNRTLFYGSYTRTDSYFEGGELASSGLPQGKELEILEPLHATSCRLKLFTQEFKLPVYDTPQADARELAAAPPSCSPRRDGSARAASWSTRRPASSSGSNFSATIPTDERVTGAVHGQSAEARHRRHASRRRQQPVRQPLPQFRLRRR